MSVGIDTKVIQDAKKLWAWGNNNGEGYSCGNPSSKCESGCCCGGQDEACKPEAAAIHEGWEIVARTTSGDVLCRKECGNYVMVCDSNGPWAVDVPV